MTWVHSFFNAGYVARTGHATGAFPNRGNPHTIQPQNFEYRMPLSPQRAPKVSLVGHNDFGIAVNGTPFDGATAEFWNRDRRSIWTARDGRTGVINIC